MKPAAIRSSLVAFALAAASLAAARTARAQDSGPTGPTGAPPADEKALVEAPTSSAAEAPDIEKKPDGTTIALAAGGQLATGNSRLLAGTANGSWDTRVGNSGFGASLLANYGQGAPPGQAIQETTENLQARLRYDWYFVDRVSLFVIDTGRHDRFQGLDFRYNLDPGLKYLFLPAATNMLWGELGYDFQADIRRDDARAELDASGNPVLGPDGSPELLPKTATDNSTRLFLGFKHAFNDEVTLSSGIEYLQSFVDASRYRVNFDAVFAASVGKGLALGLGMSARFDNGPLPGKEKLDTASTLTLVYSFSTVPTPEKKCD